MLGHLAWVSAQLPDQRLAGALVRVAGNEGRPELVRIAALSVLTQFADSTTYASIGDLLQPNDLRGLGSRLDYHPAAGASPLGAADRRTIRDEFEVLAVSAASPRVRAAAQWLTREFTIVDRVRRRSR